MEKYMSWITKAREIFRRI